MDTKKILKLANLFQVLATSEDLPADSKDLKTILKNLEELENYNSRKEYAEKNLKHLSSGSSRIVYLTPEKTILKLAKNDKGIAQNKAESNPKMKSKYLNEVISSAKDNSWMETHYLDKITVKDFEEMTDLKFEDFGDAIRYALKSVSGNTDIKKPKNFDEVEKSEIYKEVKKVGAEFKLMPGDLARISSWGTKDGRPVLIDAGLTKDVFADFYESSSSS
jgi:hypothetical protein